MSRSGVELKNPKFAKVVEVMGAKKIRIEEPGDVWEGLAEALGYSDGPAVVDEGVDQHSSDLTALLGRWIMTLLP
jgi:thiamine pyrophosphate-dependent acetolactate synthase large subunit-like protein